MLATNSSISHFTILGPLGQGGMGEVYLAFDQHLRREVALKVLPSDLAQDPERLRCFRHEALLLAAINHPNIATIYAIDETQAGIIALVLERIEGETLASRLKRGPMALEEALRVTGQIAEALEAAHARDVIHRDLKPSNVMLGPRGLVKVLDFGIARNLRLELQEAAFEPTHSSTEDLGKHDLTRTLPPRDSLTESRVLGTPGYCSPEQILAAPVDERADVFAFGCVLFECLTGARAFDGETIEDILWATLHESPDWTRLPDRTPARIRSLLDRCLSRDPESRLREIRSARMDIEEALGVRRAAALRSGEEWVSVPHNLRRRINRFVGRAQEVESTLSIVRESRLLTLTGAGGSGKTRLAEHLAEALIAERGDGVWFVDLVPVSDPSRIAPLLASLLGVREKDSESLLAGLTSFLRARPRTLLIVDNCEHVSGAAAELVRSLMEVCPDLWIVATSREPLGVVGERTFLVAGLSSPPPAMGTLRDTSTLVRTMASYDAVRLFEERALAVYPDFKLTDMNAAAVGEICGRLDGIPLAIELAAARVRVLSPDEIRNRLDDRFRLLTALPDTVAARHQKLLTTIQWSYDHLRDEEQRLLRVASVFAGDWNLEALAAVSREDDPFVALDQLTRLAEKSLVAIERRDGEETRYRLLETVRAFARDRLSESADEREIRGRHLDYFLALAETANPELRKNKQAEWLARLEREQPNFLAAADWCDDVGRNEEALRLVGCLWIFWTLHSDLRLGLQLTERALERTHDDPITLPRVWAHNGAGYLSFSLGDFERSERHYAAGLAAAEQLGNWESCATPCNGLGLVAVARGDPPLAKRFYQRAIEIWRSTGNRQSLSVVLQNLCLIDLQQGDYEGALPHLLESVDLAREVGDLASVSNGLNNLAVAAMRTGRLVQAQEAVRECAEHVRDMKLMVMGPSIVETGAELAMGLRAYEAAARLLGIAGAMRKETGLTAIPDDVVFYGQMALALRAELGDRSYKALWDEGGALDFRAGMAWLSQWLENLKVA